MDVLVGLGEEAAGAAAGIVDRLAELRVDDLRTMARMTSRGVKNWPPSLSFSPIFSSSPS